MRQLTEIDSSAPHGCKAPQVERWHVFEPVTGRWLWLKVYACCSLVYEEPALAEDAASDGGLEGRRAA